jgi:hypothetical protein
MAHDIQLIYSIEFVFTLLLHLTSEITKTVPMNHNDRHDL